MKKNWMQAVPLVLCAVLLAVVVSQEKQIVRLLDERYNQTVEMSDMRRELYTLQRKLDAPPEDADPTQPESKIASYSITPKALNAEERTVQMDVKVRLNVADDGAAAALSVHQGSQRETELRVPLSSDGEGDFTGEMTLPMNREPIRVFVTTEAGGGRQSEAMYTGAASGLLPLQLDGRSADVTHRDGSLEIAAQVRLKSDESLVTAEFHIYQNGTLADTLPAEQGDAERTMEAGGTLPCAEGDIMELRFVCTDELGLTYEFPIKGWEIKAGEKPEAIWPVTAGPLLTWPE